MRNSALFLRNSCVFLALLVACTPAQITTSTSNALAADGAVCLLERKNSSGVEVTVSGGGRTMQNATLRLDGQGISSGDARCQSGDGGLSCKLGNITAAVVAVNASSVGGSLTFYRAGSDVPHLALCAARR